MSEFFKKIKEMSQQYKGYYAIKIVWVGMAGVGKTTIIKRLTEPENLNFKETTPTMGYDVNELKDAETGITFLHWDMGGHEAYVDQFWDTNLANAHAVVFVVDASARDLVERAKTYLWGRVMNRTGADDVPTLVLYNKQDLEDVMSREDLDQAFEADKLQRRSVGVFETSAYTFQGLDESMEWLYKRLTEW